MLETPPAGGRRSFLDWLLRSAYVALLACIVYPVLRFLNPPEVPEPTTSRVEAGPTNDPAFREKGYKIVRFGAEPVIVLRAGEGDFRAFSATCTHLDCIVEYQRDRRRIWCNCHNGHYNLQGQVVSGPPPRPLARYTAHVLQQSSSAPGTVVISRA